MIGRMSANKLLILVQQFTLCMIKASLLDMRDVCESSLQFSFFTCRGNYQYSDTSDNRTLVHD